MFRPLTRSCQSRAFTQLGLRHALRLALPRAIARTNAGWRPNLGERRLTTTAETIPQETRDNIHKLHTLSPDRLSTAGQQLVDLSRKSEITFQTLTNGPMQTCRYHQEVKDELQPFPENTKGFFYYHSDPEGPELCAGVRFRICDSPAHFAHGRDLLDPTGNAWGYRLPELVKLTSANGFLSLVRHETLVDEALVADIRALDMPDPLGHYHYSLAEPFILDVRRPQNAMLFVTREKVFEMEFPQTPFADFKTGATRYPLTGAIRVQFERSHYIEHVKLGPSLVLRVLNIVRPITRSPLYKGTAVVVPKPGTLLFRMTAGKKQITRIPLKHQPMGEDLLELMEQSRVRSSSLLSPQKHLPR